MTSIVLLSALANAASIEVNPGDDIVNLTASLGPGSEIVFNDGTYTIDGVIQWQGVGTEAEPIVLRAASGAHPVIETTGGWVVANIENAQYVEVRGLTFQGSSDYFASGNGFGGLRIVNSSNITIADCEIRDVGSTGLGVGGDVTALSVTATQIHHTTNGSGISVGCGDASCATADSTFDGNWIHDLGGDYAAGMSFNPGTNNTEIRDNVVYNMAGRGIQVTSTEYGPPNTVYGNAVWAVGDTGIGVYGSAIVQNNLIFDVTGRGIRTAQDNSRPLEKVAISFNTIVNTSDWGIDLANWAGQDSMVLANNVVANPITRALRVQDPDATGIDASNYISGNVLTGYVEGLDATVYTKAFVPGAGFEDFVDAENHDYYPKHESTLIDTADADGKAYVPEKDFNGFLRDGEFPDVGAYEVVAVDNPGWQVAEGFKVVSDGTIPPTQVTGGCCNKDGKQQSALLVFPALGWFFRRRSRR